MMPSESCALHGPHTPALLLLLLLLVLVPAQASWATSGPAMPSVWRSWGRPGSKTWTGSRSPTSGRWAVAVGGLG
jgi:hypothetical protein